MRRIISRSRLRHAPWPAIAYGHVGLAFVLGYVLCAVLAKFRGVDERVWMLIMGAILLFGGIIWWNDALGERISRLERLLATREAHDAGEDGA
jgi:ABC-type polysaccharide/polyol phosphate export permease